MSTENEKRERAVFIELDAELTAELEQLAEVEARSFRKQALKCLQMGIEVMLRQQRGNPEPI
ncbi:MAG: hypothetical protein HQM09_21950 [Candidatus Riflebacteria bacterium]|nr:hypothetical protein [Candidatus Riflebacteria bacterium]